MDGIEKPHAYKYEIMNGYNYDNRFILISRVVWDAENFKWLVVQNVHVCYHLVLGITCFKQE